jgi:hypothetical protein
MDALFVIGQIASLLFLCVGGVICIIEGLRVCAKLDSSVGRKEH